MQAAADSVAVTAFEALPPGTFQAPAHSLMTAFRVRAFLGGDRQQLAAATNIPRLRSRH